MAPDRDRLIFSVLGPLALARGGRPLHVGGPQLRIMLARLLVDAGRRVSVGALVDELWGERTPPDADRTARTYISRLRRAMGSEDPLVTLPGGYELRVDPECFDAARFERLATTGRQALHRGDAALAARCLGEALDLWRGDAYAEFTGCAAMTAEGDRLDRLRLGAIEDRAAACLDLGLHSELVDNLGTLVQAYPLRERLWGQLMIALYRSGRQAEALTAFRAARDILVDAHGVEPSPELVGIHHRILSHDPTLAPRPAGVIVAPAPTPVAPAAPVPAQLPIGVRDFAGRRAELTRLDGFLADRGRTSAITIAVSGTAGVGKTSLVVHWAHRVAGLFPDGQLYVNLRGFAAGGAVVEPAEAVRQFVEAFGIPPAQIPADGDARAALYRSVLAGKRVLVVVDNARDAEHARPLLPGSPGSVAIVTSRSSLGGLVATEGAHRIPLDVLTVAEARELLASRLEPARVGADTAPVDEIIARCARLPLALAIASARPADTTSQLVAELRASAGALDAFEIRDDATSVKSVFSWSYRVLSDPAARLFRLVGCQPCVELGEAAAASLAGLDRPAAELAVRELVDANLLTEVASGRFGCHDLLRAYAAECADRWESDGQRVAALKRLVGHYLQTAYAADRRVYPNRDPIVPVPPPPGVIVDRLADDEAAWAWLDRENTSLLAVQRVTSDLDLGPATWQLAWAMSTLHQRRGRPQDMYRSWSAALAANPLTGAAQQVTALRHLAEACSRMGRFAEADGHLNRAVRLAEAARLCVELGHVHRGLARSWSRRGDDARALRHAVEALELFRRCEDHAQVAASANGVGWYAARLGEVEIGLTHLRLALNLARRGGDRLVEAHTLHSLGYLAQRTGRHERALRLLGRCLRLSRANGDIYHEASTLDSLGDSHAALGDRDLARRCWEQAKVRCEAQSRLADAQRLRAKLAGEDEVDIADRVLVSAAG